MIWQSIVGLFGLISIAWVMSENRRKVSWKGILVGLLSPKSKLIMIYALCGFANLGSLGILIGGMGSMVPERRGEIVSLGMRSIISGTLATCMAGAIVGIIT
jgi:CNT family concentrative nucleoside transporter